MTTPYKQAYTLTLKSGRVVLAVVEANDRHDGESAARAAVRAAHPASEFWSISPYPTTAELPYGAHSLPVPQPVGTAKVRHTDGPWSYDRKTGEVSQADGNVEALIATINFENTSVEQADADGAVIAASADMAAALINLVGNGFTDEELSRRWSWPIESIRAARAALAKAEGRANG